MIEIKKIAVFVFWIIIGAFVIWETYKFIGFDKAKLCNNANLKVHMSYVRFLEKKNIKEKVCYFRTQVLEYKNSNYIDSLIWLEDNEKNLDDKYLIINKTLSEMNSKELISYLNTKDDATVSLILLIYRNNYN